MLLSNITRIDDKKLLIYEHGLFLITQPLVPAIEFTGINLDGALLDRLCSWTQYIDVKLTLTLEHANTRSNS